MDVLGISAQEWILNEDENLERLLREEVWDKVPLLNANELHDFKDGALVRFRGMIQDMYGPEYYLEKFIVRNESTNESTMKTSKYCDAAISMDGEIIDLDSDCNVTGERQSYVVASIPGISSWVQQYESDKFKIAPKVDSSRIGSNSNKRSIDEVMEVDGETSVKSPIASKKATVSSQAKEEVRKPLVSPEHLLNHPLANEKSKVCHIKVYKESDVLKLNDICDFVGFLSINSATEHLFNEDDGFESQMEIQTHHPPSSLVPRIHVVYFKPLQHINPLVHNISSDNVDHLSTLRKELLIVFTQLLLGDSLAAEYLICNLISEIYLRRDFMPLGKFALNISNVPKMENVDYVFELYTFLELLLSKSHYLPLTLENMNTLAFTPKKDYECNRLTSGILQLSKNTHLVLDETKLEEGKLNAAGVQSVKALANAIQNQKVLYDFNYYPIEYDCDISFLTFSEGKSMLPSDVHVPLRPDNVCVSTFSEISDAAKHFLKPELLNDIRKYLTESQLIKYEISDQVQDLVQEEFVNMRQNGNVTAEDLHGLLVLARLVCISEGKRTLDTACWKSACKMEQDRKARSSPIKNERFDLKHSDSEEEFFESGKLATLLSDTEDDERFDDYAKTSSVIEHNKGKNWTVNRLNIESGQKCVSSTKYEKDHENLSCYYSASHTDNFSTDEHDSLRDVQEPVLQFKDLHISDSGTDLTEFANDGEFSTYLETDWHKFWSQNGEKLIWQSWVTKYSAYINPSYLNLETKSECESASGNQAGSSDNNSADIAESNLETSKFNFEENYVTNLSTKKDQERSTRCATLSRFLSTSEEKLSNDVSEGWNPLSPLSIDCETEVERLLSSRCGSHTSTRSLRTVDSLTNVTRMTVSSLDIGSSHSSGSISSVSSVTSSSESSDVIDEDYQNQWNSLWKDHYEQVYISQYNKFFSNDRERISALCISKESLHTQLSDNLTVTSLETLIGEDLKCNEHLSSDNLGVSDAKSDSELTRNSADILLAQLRDHPSNSRSGLSKNKNPELVDSKLDPKGDPISSLRSHLGNLKMAERSGEESKDVEDLSNPGRDEGCYIEETDNFALMATMGLPTAFGKSRSKQTPIKGDRTVKAHAEVNFESARQQVKAALDLIGAEFVENEPGKGMSGKVEYKMRHIRHQNRRLTFGSYPKHIRFDDDGGVENEDKESTNNLIADEVNDPAVAQETKVSNTENVSKTNEEEQNLLNPQGENTSLSEQEPIEIECPKNSNIQDVVNSNKDNLIVLNREENISEQELEFSKDLSEQARDQSDHEELDEEMIIPAPSTQKRKKRKRRIMYPPEMEANSKIKKFWPRRFSLFSKFDQGIKLDEESWYSVTPEIVARHTAERCACGVIVDAFCGAGGNTIQFALTCNKVIAIDIDPKKIELARNNAEIYGVSSRIDFIVGDFFHLAESLKADAVFVSPPWGGVAYREQTVYDLEEMLQPVAFSTLFATAEKISKNIAAFLPKNSNTATLIKMAGPGGKVEIEQDFINNKQISLTAYYNDLIKE